MIVYRLHRDIRAPFEYNLNGEGRWNPARTPMLYCAGSVALCCLEVLVHTDPALIPDNLVWSWAELPVTPEVLEARNTTDLEQTRAAGKRWINSRRSLAARVPSIVVPATDTDFNVLLNPVHEGYSEKEWSRGGVFRFDPRLFSGGPRRA